ncbi:hypothetical protein KCP75_07525 [Salmonella enterica subsp. enterica]|nr:hypothetical protein KCP75_07525 [Salmonella enterica subsp. enterica]
MLLTPPCWKTREKLRSLLRSRYGCKTRVRPLAITITASPATWQGRARPKYHNTGALPMPPLLICMSAVVLHVLRARCRRSLASLLHISAFLLRSQGWWECGWKINRLDDTAIGPSWSWSNGAVDGLRIDHIDGLADPKASFGPRLRVRKWGRRAISRVEKFAKGEQLPDDWPPVSGTTGCEFIASLAEAALLTMSR